ncbi:MAG: hypothetical protein JJE21_05240 [Spirochaetaceae bacterium]|nr:hypothetical protein [Spirochaetaceae bacterium]
MLVDEEINIVAYYSLALKNISLDNLKLTKNELKKVRGFGHSSSNVISGFLVGQLARNDDCRKKKLYGKIFLDFAISQLIKIQNSIGGRFVLIDCADELLKFYRDNGFA